LDGERRDRHQSDRLDTDRARLADVGRLAQLATAERPEVAPPAARWRPTAESVAPAGPRTKGAANLAALHTLRSIQAEARPASADEQAVLGRWSSWGALPKVFDADDDAWADIRNELSTLLSPEEWSAARRTTLNAHYTQPGVVDAMWSLVQALGFDGGRVLEPGCGSGNFIGFTPDHLDVRWTGVELDPVTAQIAQLLYSDAAIRSEGFETTSLADGSFDLVIGNVPFGKAALHDQRHNRAGHSIHNHFILKSLALCRPGGVVAVLTSRYTLDSRSDSARAAMAELADFVTAVRLPSATHRAVAGTDAVTDIVVLRRREAGAPSRHPGEWLGTADLDTLDGPVRVSKWFADRPELMLGSPRLGGQYRGDDLRVVGDFDADQLTSALRIESDRARREGLGFSEAAESRAQAGSSLVAADGLPGHLKPGSIVAIDRNTFGRLVGGTVIPFEVAKSSRRELSMLCGLRDTLAELLDVQAESLDDDRLIDRQGSLTDQYDTYFARFGPLNRFTWARTGRADPDGNDIMRRLRPKMGGFRDDPDAPNVFALEEFDPADQTAAKTAIFTRRVLAPRQTPDRTDDPAEAMLICLDQVGRVDLDHVAALLDIEPLEARARLGDLVYDDPATEQIVDAASYLSGDVRSKHTAAVDACGSNDRFQRNVDALTAALPVDLTPEEIDIRPGQSWIPTDVVASFVTDVLETDATVVHDPLTATWEIDVSSWKRSSLVMTSEWGTERKDAVTLLQAAANNSTISVYDQLDDTRVLNHQATLDAREKQSELVDRFGEWVWEDPSRSERLCTIYNERFNAHVPRSYNGGHLTLPGLAAGFAPRPHQLAAVARILAEPTTLLAHEVGAGKTATMVIGAMELRRLGLVNKPMVVVPNHMLEQFCTEWRALYPTAKVLFPAATEEGPAGRKLFVARAAVGEWDAVVVTESVFERIPLAPATEARFIDRQIDELREASSRFQAAMGRRSRTVKDIEMRALKLQERQKALLHRADKDDGATFEQIGVDYLLVDEAHHAKNLGISTRLQGQGKKGSGYAAQLDIRLSWLRERYGSKVLTLSTATPIANSLSEMWVMQHYARPDRLEAAGVGPFDAWASNFAAQVTRLELAPEGTHYRIATRLAKFRNVPDLIAMFTEFADVRTKADLELPTPALANGSAETVVVAGDAQLRGFVADLGERAERVRNRSVTPEEDNMLKISSEGRAAALDVRLVGLRPPIGETKLSVAADRIASIWATHREDRFVDPSGAEHARPGALQLVFAELGTPGGKRWGLYEALRAELIERGLPPESVRFMHEAKNPREKEQLFHAARTGAVAVLVGTTEKMGVGTNVQARCIALHHLDCPWRPADVEQREGRILRQGNQNDTVEVLRYVTEGSFDVYMWQTVELKSGFINQVLAGRHGGRSLDDVTSEQELSYAEVKALATGDDRIVRKAGLEADVTRLRRQRSAHFTDQSRLQRTVTTGLDRLARNDRSIETLTLLGERRVSTQGDRFAMTVDGQPHTKRVDAGIAVTDLVASTMKSARAGEGTDRTAVDIGGLSLAVRCSAGMSGVVQVALPGTQLRFSIEREELCGLDPVRLAQRLERLVARVPEELADTLADSGRLRSQVQAAQRRLGDTFPHDDELKRLDRELVQLDADLERDGGRDQGPDPDPPCGLGR